jgi:hypothetical protein
MSQKESLLEQVFQKAARMDSRHSVRMASLGAHTTKQIRTAVRNAGTCIHTCKIRVAVGRRVKGNNLMPRVQRLQIMEVWVLSVDRSCRRCLWHSC